MPQSASRMRIVSALLGGCVILVPALVLSGCATSAGTWQRPGTGAGTTNADLASCESAASKNGYGTIGPGFSDYVTRCMEALGYRPSM